MTCIRKNPGSNPGFSPIFFSIVPFSRVIPIFWRQNINGGLSADFSCLAPKKDILRAYQQDSTSASRKAAYFYTKIGSDYISSVGFNAEGQSYNSSSPSFFIPCGSKRLFLGELKDACIVHLCKRREASTQSTITKGFLPGYCWQNPCKSPP